MAVAPDERGLLRGDTRKDFSRRSRRAWRRTYLRIEYIVPFLFLLTVTIGLIVSMGEASAPTHIVYSTVGGFFQQDDPTTDPKDFDFTTTNFGLIDRAYDTDAEFDPGHEKSQWERFERQVLQMNQDSNKMTQYKVLYMGRHGQGDHNVAEEYYGTSAWDCYWSMKDGNGTITWADAKLTNIGIGQAEKANAFWKKAVAEQKIPLPKHYYVSPLSRCLETLRVTFSGISEPEDMFIQIKELFRETIGVHTCDQRSSKSYIHKEYPTYSFEDGFAEEDPLWDPEYRETNSAQDVRAKTVLDDVFTHDPETFLSITAHGGEIGSILRVLSHIPFGLGTGQAIPVLVKAEVVNGEAPPMKSEPWKKVTPCMEPPAPANS